MKYNLKKSPRSVSNLISNSNLSIKKQFALFSMNNTSIDILSEIIADKQAKINTLERKALAKNNPISISDNNILQLLQDDLKKDIDSMELMINQKRNGNGKESSPYHSFIPTTRPLAISKKPISGVIRSSTITNLRNSNDGHSRNNSSISRNESLFNPSFNYQTSNNDNNDYNDTDNDNNIEENEMLEDSNSSVQTVDDETFESPPKHFYKGIEIIAKKKAYLFSKIITAERDLDSTTFGIKENEKEFPALPVSSKEQSKVEYQVLKNNNLVKIRNDRTLSIQEYLEKYKSASSSLNIKLGFPETNLPNCPPSFCLTNDMIGRIKRQIGIRTWQISAEFERKRIEDTSKKLLKQQKFQLLKEKRLAQNTPELILERLRKQVTKLSLQLTIQQTKIKAKGKKSTNPSNNSIPKKKSTQPLRVVQEKGKKKPPNTNLTGPKPVRKNTGRKERGKSNQKQIIQL